MYIKVIAMISINNIIYGFTQITSILLSDLLFNILYSIVQQLNKIFYLNTIWKIHSQIVETDKQILIIKQKILRKKSAEGTMELAGRMHMSGWEQ